MCEVTVSNAKSVLPFLSLDEVDTLGAGAVLDLGGVSREFTMQVKIAGTSGEFGGRLEGSLDGVNYYTLATASGNGAVSSAGAHLARYVRAMVTTLTGDYVITAYVAAGEVY
jgi:hypothetical protein